MTKQEWQQLEDLWQRARAGDEEAFSALCEIVDAKLKRIVTAILSRGGVRPKELVDDAWQEAMLAFVKHYQQVKTIRYLPYWLAITALRCAAKNRWPRYSKRKKPSESVQQPEPLRPMETKTITIDGRPFEVKIYPSCNLPPETGQLRPRLEPLTESIIEKYRATVPDQVRRIHNQRVLSEVQKALPQLPPRWRRAVELVCEESRTEAAQMLGCSRKRLDKLLKKARKRLRLLLPAYVFGRKMKRKTTSSKAKGRTKHVGAENVIHDKDKALGSGTAFGVDDDSWWTVLESMWGDAMASHFTEAELQSLFGCGLADLKCAVDPSGVRRLRMQKRPLRLTEQSKHSSPLTKDGTQLWKIC